MLASGEVLRGQKGCCTLHPAPCARRARSPPTFQEEESVPGRGLHVPARPLVVAQREQQHAAAPRSRLLLLGRRRGAAAAAAAAALQHGGCQGCKELGHQPPVPRLILILAGVREVEHHVGGIAHTPPAGRRGGGGRRRSHGAAWGPQAVQRRRVHPIQQAQADSGAGGGRLQPR